MNFLFRYLFNKVKPIYIIPILVIIGFFSIYVFPTFIGANAVVKNEFPLEKSPNPKASQHFINAMEHRIKLRNLHKSMDYDNPIMKAVLDLIDEEYNKGVKLLPKDSAEDVYWYVMIYRGIYGIGGIPDKRDMSLSYEKTVKTDEELINHYDEIYNKIKRLVIDDFDFDVPRITQYKFEVMDDLVGEFVEKSITLSKNKNIGSYENYIVETKNIQKYYNKYSQKYLPLANKEKINSFFAKFRKAKLQKNLLFSMERTKLKASCKSIEFSEMLNYLEELKYVMKYKPKYFNVDFSKKSNFVNILDVTYDCKNHKKQAKELILYFSPYLTKKLNLKQGINNVNK